MIKISKTQWGDSGGEKPAREAAVERRLPTALLVFGVSLVILTCLSLLGPLMEFKRLPRWDIFTVLWQPYEGFDFYDYLARMRLSGTPAFFTMPGYPWYYPAGGVLLYRFFYALCPGGDWRPGYLVYGATVLLGCLFGAHRLIQAMRSDGVRRRSAEDLVYGTLLLSWPIYFSLQRGNLESVLWLVLAAAIWLVAKGRWTPAAVLLGAVGSVKLYPAICFALFLRERRWKELAIGAGVMVLITLAGLRYMEPDLGLAVKGVAHGVQQWTLDFATATSKDQMMSDHSLYEVVKAVFGVRPNGIHNFLMVTSPLMLALFLGRVLWMPIASQVLFLITASVSLAPASFDYTLQSLYIPWAWVAMEMVRNREWRDRWMWVLMFFFAVEFAPMNFVLLDGQSVGGLSKGSALIGMLLIALARPIPGRQQKEPALV